MLLTHATPAHIGAFAHCCKAFPHFTKIPVYATSPVISMGRALLQDMYASEPLAATFMPSMNLSSETLAGPTTAATVSAGASPEFSAPATTTTTQNENSSTKPGSPTTPAAGEASSAILLPPLTNDEIARYFSLIRPLKFSQPLQPSASPFSPPLHGLTLTAYNAGHTVGGTMWHIQHGMESIVYAADWNHARENVVAGASWFGHAGGAAPNGAADIIEQLQKPTAFVCGARGGGSGRGRGGSSGKMAQLDGGRKKRDQLLLDTLRACFAKGGTVLIPTDTSARVLELAYVLEHAWRDAAAAGGGGGGGQDMLRNGNVYLAGKKAHGTMRLARSMLEWMDDSIVREFEAGEGGDARGNEQSRGAKGPASTSASASGAASSANKRLGPFTFRHLKIIEQQAKLEHMLSSNRNPKVILTSDTSLDWGYSKIVLQHIAGNEQNMVLLTEAFPKVTSEDKENSTEKPTHTRLGREIWRLYEKRSSSGVDSTPTDHDMIHDNDKQISITNIRREPLQPDDVLIYQQYLATQHQLQGLAQGRGEQDMETAATALDDQSESTTTSDDEDDDDDDGVGGAGGPEQQGKVLTLSSALTHAKNKSKTMAAAALSDADLGVNVLLRRRGVYDFDVRGKKGRDRMFPHIAPRKRADAYGAFIRAEDFRAEEREDGDAQPQTQPHGGLAGTRVGEKRRWGETGNETPSSSSGGRRGRKKQRHGSVQTTALMDERNADNTLDFSTHLDDEDSEAEGEVEEEGPQGPSRAVLTTAPLTLRAGIAYIDFTGLHDKRSLEMLIPLTEPRKLILFGGMQEETLELAGACQELLAAKAGIDVADARAKAAVQILAPAQGETVDASIDVNAWMVKLSKPLVKSLKWKWKEIGNLGVVALAGLLRGPGSEKEKEKMEAEAKAIEGEGQEGKAKANEKDTSLAKPDSRPQIITPEDSYPILDLLPVNLATATTTTTAPSRPVTRPLHVGDMRLVDLRKIMQSRGHRAEFRGEGTLLIDNCVVVRKSTTGRIEIEHVPLPPLPSSQSSMMRRTPGSSDTRDSFQAVRNEIYQGLVVVAGR